MPRYFANFVMASLAISAIAAAADLPAPHDARLAAYRQSGDYSAAEDYCRQQLARTALTNVERHALTLELAELALQHVLRTPPSEADSLWSTAQDTARDYADQYANNPRRAQLYLQSALAFAKRAELLSAGDLDAGEPARGFLREAIKLSRRAKELIEMETRDASRTPRRSLPEGAIPPWNLDELRSIDRRVRFELARMLRMQAECYGQETEDRALAATQASELFRTLADLNDAEPLAWPSRVQLIGCERLLAHWDAAEQAVARCNVDRLPLALRGALRAEQLRLALACDDLELALRLATQPAEAQREHTLDEDLALLDVHLALAGQAAGADERSRHHAAEASRRVRAIANHWGAYWGDAAAARLARSLTSGGTSADFAAWTQAGDALYQQGQTAPAIAAYDRARTQAAADGQPDVALLLAMKAAAIEQARGRFAEAARRFHAAALEAPKQARAADAHFAAISNLARSGVDEASQLAWLDEHLHYWPNASSSSQARLWSAHARARRRDWRAAIELLAKVSASDPLAADAIRAARSAYFDWLLELSPGTEREQVIAGALRHFGTYRSAGDSRMGTAATACLAASAEAELLIRERRSYAAAERLLDQVLESPSAVASPAHVEAEAWRLVARAAQPEKCAAALDELSKRPEIPAATIEAMLAAVGQLGVAATPKHGQGLGAIQLKLIERRRVTLPTDDAPAQRQWALRYATTLPAVGRRDEAIEQLRSIRQIDPSDSEVAVALGRLLVEVGEPSSRAEALECWRTVERAYRADTPDWFEAKYQIAALTYASGDATRAAKIIQLTRTLHPDLGGDVWKPRFEELLRRCQSGQEKPFSPPAAR